MVTVFVHRSRCAALERGDARGADSFGRHEPNQPLAALADCAGAFALDMCKEGVLLGAIKLPETEIVLVDGGRFSVPPPAAGEEKASASQSPKFTLTTTAKRAQ
jgi:hypothetical protein